MMDKVQKYNSFSTNTPLSESYRSYRLRVFDKLLRKIFEPKREEVVGGWRRLHDEELCNLNASRNIIMAIKSRRMRWAGHVTCMEM
jgi:hypothetical protein